MASRTDQRTGSENFIDESLRAAIAGPSEGGDPPRERSTNASSCVFGSAR